jgi:hypothetical protein
VPNAKMDTEDEDVEEVELTPWVASPTTLGIVARNARRFISKGSSLLFRGDCV